MVSHMCGAACWRRAHRKIQASDDSAEITPGVMSGSRRRFHAQPSESCRCVRTLATAGHPLDAPITPEPASQRPASVNAARSAAAHYGSVSHRSSQVRAEYPEAVSPKRKNCVATQVGTNPGPGRKIGPSGRGAAVFHEGWQAICS